MAIIDSEAVGRGSGSMGNVTYRYTRGKTVMSRRITSNKSNTGPQIKQRKGFGTLAHMAKALRSLLRIGFSKHKDARVDNLFMHTNTPLLAYVKSNPNFDADLPSITNLCIMLSNPAFGSQIVVADGSVKLTIKYDWGPNSTVAGEVNSSRKFVAGDMVALGICYSYLLMGSYFEMVEVYTKKLTDVDIEKLAYKTRFLITEEAFPEMDVFGILPSGFSDVEILVTFILVGEKDASTSYIVAMPDMAPEFHVASQTVYDGAHMRLVMDNPQAFAAEIGERALGLDVGFKDDILYPELNLCKVADMSRDTGGKINGIILSPPMGKAFYVAEYEGREEDYIGLISGGRYIVILTGVVEPDYQE
jgi:hypothetical protein